MCLYFKVHVAERYRKNLTLTVKYEIIAIITNYKSFVDYLELTHHNFTTSFIAFQIGCDPSSRLLYYSQEWEGIS